jgi:hypothetical protein
MTDSQPLTGDEPHTRECLDRYKANLPCNCRAPQPLTGDELAGIKARLEGLRSIRCYFAGSALSTKDALRLVAEVERLRAQVDALVELAATADRPSSDDEWWMGRADALDDVRRILGKP